MTIRDIGLGLARAVPSLAPVARAVYNTLPEWLHDTPTSRARSFFKATPLVTFVQIGAFDGRSGDPIRRLIVENANWKGILIEPQPEAFEQLKANYRQQSSRLTFLNCAISGSSGEKAFFAIPETQFGQHNLPDWAREIASFDPDHIRRHFPQVEIEVMDVKIMTFREVADAASIDRVDLIVIDVEGHERPILESIDFERFGVSFIIYEHKHLPPRDQSKLSDFLSGRGFLLKIFGRDTIAWKRRCRA
jgi:FkbM family methyltransferase